MKPVRIFIVDDDPEELIMMKEVFAAKGIEQATYFNEAEALLDALKLTPDHQLPDIIVSDLNMPKFSGSELISVIRENSRYDDIPIIIYSTSSFAHDIEHCLKAGAYEFVVKPNVFAGYEKLADRLVLFQ
jgi:CheY-like chemotaxis protein